jgi:integrase
MGQIRKRGGVWWIRYYRDGRRFEESARTDKWEKARDLLRNREGDISKGVPVSSQIGRFRFEDAATDIENEYAINKRKSLDNLKRRIKLHLTPFFGGRRMSTITAADVRAYAKKRLDAGASAGEINRELAALKRMFTLAVKANKLMVRPHIPMLEERNVRTGFFERDEFEAVRSNLPEALRPVLTFAYVTGWRIRSEVLTLQWRQVDMKAGTVTLDPGTTKNNEGRTFPFGVIPELRAMLEAQEAARKAVEKARDIVCPWVFHRHGRPIKSFRGAWDNACEAAGVSGRIPHDLRRTAVRNLERAGVSRSVAMKLTGHKTESVYRRYAIVSEADLSEGARRLAGTIPGTIGRRGRVSRMKRTS